MNAQRHILPIGVLVMALVGCVIDEDVYDVISLATADENAIVLDINVGTTTDDGITGTATTTRSNPIGDTQSVFNSGDTVAIASGSSSNFINYTYSNSAWTPLETTKYLSWQDSKLTFYAYYPVNSKSTYSSFTIPTDQSELKTLRLSDYMRAEGTTVSEIPEDKTLTLALSRKTAKIKIKPSLQTQFSSSATITSIKVYSMYATIESSSTAAATEIKTYNENDTAYYALVAPYSSNTSNQKMIEVEVKDGEGTTTLTYTPDTYPTLEEGYSYTYNLSVGRSSIEVASISVNEWTGSTIESVTTDEVSFECSETNSITTTWLSNNIKVKGVTLSVTGDMQTTDIDALRSWLASDAAGNDAEITLDLSGLSGDVPSASTTTAYEVTGLYKLILPQASSEAKTRASSSGVTIGNHAFSKCSKLTTVENWENVDSVGKCAFCKCAGLTTVNLTSATKNIGDSAFYQCINLVEANIPNVTYIGKSAFSQDTCLFRVDASNVTHYGDHSFSYCRKLMSMDFSKAVVFEACAFRICSRLSGDIDLPKVTTICDSAFSGCSKVNSFSLNDVDSIYRYAFYSCSKATSITWNKVLNISTGAFMYCRNVKSYDWTKINRIQGYAFVGNECIDSIDLRYVTYVGADSFKDCTNLKYVYWPDTVSSIRGSTFIRCPSLEKIDNTDGIKQIFHRPFQNCYSLKSISLPNVTEIRRSEDYTYHFMNCYALETVRFGNIGSSTLYDSIFLNCTSLRKIDLSKVTKDNLPGCKSTAFKGCNTDSITIYVDGDALSKWKSALSSDGWKDTGLKESNFKAATK